MAARLRRAAVACLALGMAVQGCSGRDRTATTTSDTASDTAWHAFEGSWTAAGRRRALLLGPDRPTSIVDVSGTVALSGEGRPGVAFRAEAIVLTDAETGGIGRAVWTDDRGDRVFSELTAGGRGSDRVIHGVVVGGTGRFAGVEGEYRFTWQYLMEAEDGTLQGRSQGLTGRFRLTGARP